MTRVHVVVSGRVQGVGFRWFCREEALGRGLGGWVRNLPDGRVEAVFEGEPDAVDAAVAWCRRGPRGAEVEQVEATTEEPRGEGRFRIGR